MPGRSAPSALANVAWTWTLRVASSTTESMAVMRPRALGRRPCPRRSPAPRRPTRRPARPPAAAPRSSRRSDRATAAARRGRRRSGTGRGSPGGCPSTPANGARIVLRSMVARISPTRGLGLLVLGRGAVVARPSETTPLPRRPRIRSRFRRASSQLRLGRGELRLLLARVELHQHLARPHGRGRTRRRSARRCRAGRR